MNQAGEECLTWIFSIDYVFEDSNATQHETVFEEVFLSLICGPQTGT